MALFYSIEDELYQQASQFWGWVDRTKLTFPASRASSTFPDCDWEMDLNYAGDTRTLAYARVPFTALINNATANWALITIDRPLAGAEVITELRNQLGLPVKLSDFDNPSIPYQSGSYKLTASLNSDAFTGDLNFVIRTIPRRITVLPTKQYAYNFRNQLWYAHYDYEDTISGYTWTARFNAGLMTYGLDYTSQADFLKTLPAFSPPWTAGNIMTNAALLTSLANALKAVDGIGWLTTSARTDYTLYNSWCLYNGPVAGVDPSITNGVGDIFIYPAVRHIALAKAQGVPNPEYDNVAVIQIGTPYSGGVGYQFALMIHYNNWS